VSRFLDETISRYPILKECELQIVEVFEILRTSFRSGNKLLICGNGGSAADAEHWSGELLKGFELKRPVRDERLAELPHHISIQLQGGFPVIPLTGFISFRTAFANDVDPALVFAQLVYVLGQRGDVLVGISTSGHAVNVCHAVRVAGKMGLKTIGLSGGDGGLLATLTTVCIRVPEKNTRLIQEMHLPIYHCLSLMLEDEFFS
jgi:D-sedoheptulose 7-phosphate isomerase